MIQQLGSLSSWRKTMFVGSFFISTYVLYLNGTLLHQVYVLKQQQSVFDVPVNGNGTVNDPVNDPVKVQVGTYSAVDVDDAVGNGNGGTGGGGMAVGIPGDEDGGDGTNNNNNSENVHPIDELISREAKEGSSMEMILEILKNYSQPEYYGEEITSEDDIQKETERCQRYGFQYNGNVSMTTTTEPGKPGKPGKTETSTRKRRRIFWGSLIADDSWHAIAAHIGESYGLYHTVAFIESNTTQTMTKRQTRFDNGSLNLTVLQSGIFGPKTAVHVDSYVNTITFEKSVWDEMDLHRENLQRGHILQRWKANGMRPDDIGIVSDVDEVFTRDFLLALSTCDVPQFRRGQDCLTPKVIASTMIFEMTPDCSFHPKRWHHPDVISGECIDTIGDSNLHKPGLREFANGTLGKRRPGYGLTYTNYMNMTNTSMYPLWRPVDFRNAEGGNQVSEKPHKGHTGYHFHNFFNSFDVLRNKYRTYGHSVEDADSRSVAQLQLNLDSGVRCIMGRPDDDLKTRYNKGGFEGIKGRRPIIFEENQSYRDLRTRELKEMIEADEKKFNS